MAQENPYAKYVTGGSAPTPPASIPGTTTSSKQAQEQRAQSAEARAQAAEERARRDQQLQEQKFALEQERSQREAQKSNQGTVEQGKSASFLGRAVQANKDYTSLGQVGPRSIPGQWASEAFPNVTNSLSSSERQRAEQAERAFIAAVLRYDSGAAIPPQEFVTQGQIYFPRPGDSPEVIKQKAQARITAIQGLQASAGPAGANIQIPDFEALQLQAANTTRPPEGGDAPPPPPNVDTTVFPVLRGGLPVGTDITFGGNGAGAPDWWDRDRWLASFGMDPDKETKVIAFWNQNRGNSGLTVEGAKRWYAENGIPVPPDETMQFEVNRAREGKYQYSAFDDSAAKAERQKNLEQLNSQFGQVTGNLNTQGKFDAPNAYGQRMQEGTMVGFGDEVSGVGGAIGSLFRGNNPAQGYRDARDAARLRQDQMRETQGVPGYIAEAIGSIPAALVAPGGTSRTVGGAAKAGATFGAVQGAGEARNLSEVPMGASVGGLGGAVLGATLQGGFNALGRAVSRAPKTNALIPNAQEVAQAGEAEGVNVINAMLDPRRQNRVTGVDASMVGGPRFQKGIQQVESQIEGRVSALGQGGNPMDSINAGQTYQQAGERFIKDSGRRADKQYTAAEKLAGDAKVTPENSLRLVDDTLARLSETPGTNAAEISFLKSMRDDLSKDLSVGGLRRMRTSLRKKITKGDLVFGEDEATVLRIMDEASKDIEAGLIKQGKGGAAKAFKEADAAYRDRMEYITGTLQKIIGKRDSNFSSEQVAAKLSSMARGKDSAGVKRFLDTLTPEERADVAATFADLLGKNGKDGFSVSQFLSQTSEKKFPVSALKVVFGEEGAASIARLRVISNEVERVTSAMNSRTSKSAIPQDYRSWLFNLMLGGGVPLTAGGNALTALGGAAALTGVKAGRDVLSARALLSKDISKWLVSAPKTTSPAAINKHIERLGTISSRAGPYQMDAAQISEFLRNAITQSPGRAAASQDEAN